MKYIEKLQRTKQKKEELEIGCVGKEKENVILVLIKGLIGSIKNGELLSLCAIIGFARSVVFKDMWKHIILNHGRIFLN